MLIRCWGSRGSISVSGRSFVKYGGDTTCVEVVGASGEIIVIDAGTGIRLLGNQLTRRKRLKINLLLTHAHWDHLSGFPFFKPIYKKGVALKIYGPQPTQRALKNIISKTMASPYFPVELDDISADITFLSMGNKGYYVDSIKVSTIPISHPNQGVGYRFEENGRSFVFITDNELTYPHHSGARYADYVKFARGADVLFHDAEYTRKDYKRTKGWGHSVFLDTLRLALDAKVGTLGLIHHNQDRTDKEIDAIVKKCRQMISKKGSPMKCLAVSSSTEIKI